jgi:hypothetical protein
MVVTVADLEGEGQAEEEGHPGLDHRQGPALALEEIGAAGGWDQDAPIVFEARERRAGEWLGCRGNGRTRPRVIIEPLLEKRIREQELLYLKDVLKADNG